MAKRDNWRMLMQAAQMYVAYQMRANPIRSFFTWTASSLLINSLFGPKPPDQQPNSESYTWKHTGNKSASQDIPMPIVYGKARVKPVVKNRYITVKGDKEYLHLLLSFAGHRIDEYEYKRVVGLRPYGKDNIVRSLGGIWDEPGKTYVATKNGAIGSNYTFIGVVDGEGKSLDTYQWEVGHGTAKITDILINGNPIENFETGNNERFMYETRPGLALQNVIDGFDLTYTNNVSSETVNLPFPEIDKIGADFLIPLNTTTVSYNQHTLRYNGRNYIINKQLTRLPYHPLNYLHWKIGFNGYVMSDAVSKGTEYFRIAIIDRSDGSFRFTQDSIKPTTATWTNPAVSITNAHNIEAYFRLPSGLYGVDQHGTTVKARASIYAQYREVGTGTWVNFDLSQSDSFDSIDTSASVHIGHILRNEANPFALSVKAVGSGSLLDPSKIYEVRLSASSIVDVVLVNVAGITIGREDVDSSDDGFAYPGEALLGIHALATDRLSGEIEVTGVVERSTVKVYNTRSLTTGGPPIGWSDAQAICHPWAIYDILTNGHPDHPEYPDMNADASTIQPIYGCGVDKDLIDYESFRTWVETINNPESDGGLGWSLNTVFDEISTAWDAILRICAEGRGVVYPIGTQFFAAVDAAPDSLATLTTFNKDNMDQGTIVHDWVDKAKKANSLEITYWDASRNYGQVNFVIRTSDWDSSQVINDPLRMSLYGTTNYNQATALGIYLLNNNELLSQMVQFRTDTEGLAITPGDVIYINHVSIGTTPRLFRVISIDGDGEYKRNITCIEYDARVYQANIVNASVGNQSLTNVAKVAPKVDPPTLVTFNTASGLTLAEILSRNRTTGEYKSSIGVSWDADQGVTWGEWEISHRDIDAYDLGWIGIWDSNTAYSVGDKVVYGFNAYTSLIDFNTTVPTADSWSQI